MARLRDGPCLAATPALQQQPRRQQQQQTQQPPQQQTQPQRQQTQRQRQQTQQPPQQQTQRQQQHTQPQQQQTQPQQQQQHMEADGDAPALRARLRAERLRQGREKLMTFEVAQRRAEAELEVRDAEQQRSFKRMCASHTQQQEEVVQQLTDVVQAEMTAFQAHLQGQEDERDRAEASQMVQQWREERKSIAEIVETVGKEHRALRSTMLALQEEFSLTMQEQQRQSQTDFHTAVQQAAQQEVQNALEEMRADVEHEKDLERLEIELELHQRIKELEDLVRDQQHTITELNAQAHAAGAVHPFYAAAVDEATEEDVSSAKTAGKEEEEQEPRPPLVEDASELACMEPDKRAGQGDAQSGMVTPPSLADTDRLDSEEEKEFAGDRNPHSAPRAPPHPCYELESMLSPAVPKTPDEPPPTESLALQPEPQPQPQPQPQSRPTPERQMQPTSELGPEPKQWPKPAVEPETKHQLTPRPNVGAERTGPCEQEMELDLHVSQGRADDILIADACVGTEDGFGTPHAVLSVRHRDDNLEQLAIAFDQASGVVRVARHVSSKASDYSCAAQGECDDAAQMTTAEIMTCARD